MKSYLIVGIGLATGAISLAGCGSLNQTAPPSSKSPATTSGRSPSHGSYDRPSSSQSQFGLTHLTMVSSHVGWAIDTVHQIVKTVNGGRTWSNVTPPELPSHASSLSIHLSALSSSRADVAWVEGTHGSVRFSSTTDGGSRWRTFRTTATSYGGVQLDPLSRSDIWMLAPSAPGSPVSTATVYHSITGGKTWKRVAHGPYLTTQFLSNTIGWAGGFFPVAGQSPLWETTTGGHSWSQIALPFPRQFRSYQMTVRRPRVFAHHVLVPTNLVKSGGSVLLLYRQKTGGKGAWSAGAPLRSAQSVPVTFVNGHQGWAIIHNSSSSWTLMQTTNAGTTWRVVTTLAVPFDIHNIQFVTARDGWLWGVKTGATRSEHFLWRTTDGGHHWQNVSTSRAVTH